MLCPVCKEHPLRGRQATCSTKCRSARYRDRKQQQRDESQQGGGHGSASSAPSRPSSGQRHRTSDTKKWEQLVSAAVDRVIEAIQHLGHLPTPPAHDLWRVDLREQITAQAPKLAVGYRIVLPGRHAGDAPMLTPKRSRARDVAWYSLTPFEYPDDIRLRDGCWYRLIWIDAQEKRVRLQPGESVPGLYYFVGPAQLSPGVRTDLHQAESPASPPLPQEPVPALVHAEEKPSLLSSFPPQLIAETTEKERTTLASLPPLTLDDSNLLIRFVQQPEWMLKLLHEERAAAAREAGLPTPPEPPTSLAHHERKTIHALLTKRMPAPLVLLCKLLHAYARKFGPEVLSFLPTPLAPLPEAEQQRLEAAIANMQKLTYLDYVHTRQESLLRGLPLPQEPVVSIGSKERSQLRRMLRDTRAVIFFERHAHPPLAFIRTTAIPDLP